MLAQTYGVTRPQRVKFWDGHIWDGHILSTTDVENLDKYINLSNTEFICFKMNFLSLMCLD